jgi:hypothetical protein
MKPTSSSVRRSFTAPANFAVKCYRTLPRPFRLSLCAMLLFLVVAGALTSHTGCATTPAGLDREQALYRAGTNVVAQAQSILPFVPAPVASPLEIVLGLAGAALGAWNLHQ